MSAWLVRQEGSPTAVGVPSPAEVLEGLRDGNWLPTDEVKGPSDVNWQSIETHPTFAEAAQELEPPKPPGEDETNLDMNPLIDVCLVLLIFFILTITYASLERAIDIPPEQPDEKGAPPKVDLKDIRDQVFVVRAKMDGNRAVVMLEKDEVKLDQLEGEMKKAIGAGRTEMVLDVEPDVPWGVETAILDAAKGARVLGIINNRRKKK